MANSTAASEQRPEVGLASLTEFIRSVRLESAAIAKPTAQTKLLYRRFYALLVYDYLISGSDLSEDSKLYAKECFSDLSHGFFLTTISLYKPALTSVRSSVENCIRFSLLLNGSDATKIESVYELFDVANVLYASRKQQKARLNHLRGIYRELCKTVHSASSDYMNLNVPFGTMLIFDDEKFDENQKVLSDVCHFVGELLFIELNSLVRKCHHKHQDILSDAVAKSVRREASSLLDAD